MRAGFRKPVMDLKKSSNWTLRNHPIICRNHKNFISKPIKRGRFLQQRNKIPEKLKASLNWVVVTYLDRKWSSILLSIALGLQCMALTLFAKMWSEVLQFPPSTMSLPFPHCFPTRLHRRRKESDGTKEDRRQGRGAPDFTGEERKGIFFFFF